VDLGASFDGPLCLQCARQIHITRTRTQSLVAQAAGTVCSTTSPTPLLWITERSRWHWSEKDTQIGSIAPCTPHTCEGVGEGQCDADQRCALRLRELGGVWSGIDQRCDSFHRTQRGCARAC
jgi:hypothetical protein